MGYSKSPVFSFLYSNAPGRISTSQRCLVLAVAGVLSLEVTPVLAQSGLEEVIVTARKRVESAQDTPVVLSAFNQETLEANAISSVEDLSTLIPNLSISESSSGVTPLVTLRGVSSGSALLNASTDQAISINIDGVQLSRGMGLRLGQHDIQQMEVLKGPQALFFGKNSPGGIIVIHTADPTDEPFSEFRIGYEEAGETLFGHATVSGPLIDSLGGRLTVSYSDSEGFYDNDYPGVADDQQTFYDEVITRGTLKWDPSDAFTARAKLTYSDRDGGTVNTWQLAECDDTPLLGRAVYSDCDLNDTFSIADPSQDPSFDPSLSATGLWDEKPSHEFDSILTSVDFSWEISERWTLDGVTGYYNIENKRFDNFYHASVLALGQDLEDESISQELRLSGDYEDLTVTVGGYVDDRSFESTNEIYLEITGIPNFIAPSKTDTDSDSWSIFTQASYAIGNEWEVSVGGRYTSENISYKGRWLGDGVALKSGVVGQSFVVENPNSSYDNFSPEITVSYRPTDDVLLFASYKEGFKAGGYDGAATDAGASNSPAYLLVPGQNDFNEEQVDGFELSAKTEWLDNRLRVNGTAYYYEYSDLQITSVDIQDSLFTARTLNAGESTSQGVELEATYLPENLEGLILTATANYLKAEWDEALVPCSDWQEVVDATGCDIGGTQLTQLEGITTSWSPEYGFSAGAVYDTAITSNLGIRLNVLGVWTDKQDGLGYGDYDPRAYVQDYWMLNAGISLYQLDDTWTVDLIGRNLLDEDIATVFGPSAGSQLPLEPLQAGRSAPRQILLQFTYRP